MLSCVVCILGLNAPSACGLCRDQVSDHLTSQFLLATILSLVRAAHFAVIATVDFRTSCDSDGLDRVERS